MAFKLRLTEKNKGTRCGKLESEHLKEGSGLYGGTKAGRGQSVGMQGAEDTRIWVGQVRRVGILF